MPLSPFDRLGLSPSLDLNPADLEQAYVQATAAYHPDAFITQPQEKAYAEGHMADLNTAYQRLSHRVLRAIALYERHFGPYTPETVPCASLFLAQFFELQEQALTLTTTTEREDFQREITQRLEEVYGTLKTAFDAQDEQLALRSIQMYQYLTKLLPQHKEEKPHVSAAL